jgi:hypothetical protein
MHRHDRTVLIRARILMFVAKNDRISLCCRFGDQRGPFQEVTTPACDLIVPIILARPRSDVRGKVKGPMVDACDLCQKAIDRPDRDAARYRMRPLRKD